MTSHSNAPKTKRRKYVHLLQEFSLPLLAGVIAALILTNVQPHLYDKMVHGTYAFFTGEEYQGHGHDAADGDVNAAVGEAENQGKGAADDEEPKAAGGHGHGWRHYCTLHFIVNDLFMVIFFGIAAKEITESCLPGGALNPPSKAINPLLGTLGGVVGPAGVYILLNLVMGDGTWPWQDGWGRGWGIPTATDIALAWLIARLVFGNNHPAISFLLLLAVADDGIGLLIIAFFYPTNDPVWLNLLWLIPGMAVAYGLRRKNVQSWSPYILIGGAFAWWGLFSAHLHPALALVPIVPFLPGPERDEGIFREVAGVHETNPLDRFEHDLKLFVDLGLFFFAFANAGVEFSSMSNLTWIVLLALLFGKTIGITGFSWLGVKLGAPLPSGMDLRHLVVAGVVAGLGLTVALFVAGQAFEGADQGASKMGALFSGGIAVLAIVLGRMLGVKDGAGQNNGAVVEPAAPAKAD